MVSSEAPVLKLGPGGDFVTVYRVAEEEGRGPWLVAELDCVAPPGREDTTMNPSSSVATAVRESLDELEQQAEVFTRCSALMPDQQIELHRIQERARELREALDLMRS